MASLKEVIERNDTKGGKIFTFFILIIGLGIIAIPTGLFASALSKARESDP